MEIAKDRLRRETQLAQHAQCGYWHASAFDTYVGTLDNHFSTIGYVGMNELCMNYLGMGITTIQGKALAEELLGVLL